MYDRMLPNLDQRLFSILNQTWPKFSENEMARRRLLFEKAMEKNEVGHLILYGSGGNGTAVPWITNWSATNEVVCLITPGEKDTMFVQYYNHVPLAEKIADSSEVYWGGESTIQSVISEIKCRNGLNQRIGIIGPLQFKAYQILKATSLDLVDMNQDYLEMRMVKSDEEIDWFKIGASLSDLSIKSLENEVNPGLNEHQIADIIERAYIPWGGRTGIHFIGSTSMEKPSIHVPAQYTSNRIIEKGDIIITEISVKFGEYSGQVLRTFVLGTQPTPIFRRLHETADAAFEEIFKKIKPGSTCSSLIEAGKLIDDAGFTICDDLIHGYGGGYLPPVLGLPSRRTEKIPDITLETGMMLVIQPNVITLDKRFGVQTGECVVVTEKGCESLHQSKRGLIQINL